MERMIPRRFETLEHLREITKDLNYAKDG